MTAKQRQEVERRFDASNRIWTHYAHACEKHSYFCDSLLPKEYRSAKQLRGTIKSNLARSRHRIKVGGLLLNLLWNEIADCEVWEATEAIANNNTSAAVEELYDVIAVLLRTIDVLEGRQALGKPKGGAE